MMRLRGRAALGTGGFSGIGAAGAVVLARAGAAVTVTGTGPDRLAQVAELAEATVLVADLL